MHIFIASTGEVHNDDLVAIHFWRELLHISQCVAGFQGRYNAFGAAEVMKRLQRLIIGDRNIRGGILAKNTGHAR